MEETKTLTDVMKEEEESLYNFMIMLIQPMPQADKVRIVVDDATSRITLKRDKFLDLLLDVMDLKNPQVFSCYSRIRECLFTYGGFYLYNRVDNIFQELSEVAVEQHLTPSQIIEQSAKENVTTVHFLDKMKQIKNISKEKVNLGNMRVERNLFNRKFH